MESGNPILWNQESGVSFLFECSTVMMTLMMAGVVSCGCFVFSCLI